MSVACRESSRESALAASCASREGDQTLTAIERFVVSVWCSQYGGMYSSSPGAVVSSIAPSDAVSAAAHSKSGARGDWRARAGIFLVGDRLIVGDCERLFRGDGDFEVLPLLRGDLEISEENQMELRKA